MIVVNFCLRVARGKNLFIKFGTYYIHELQTFSPLKRVNRLGNAQSLIPSIGLTQTQLVQGHLIRGVGFPRELTIPQDPPTLANCAVTEKNI
ncbi:MAG: hypothetical protein R2864_14900 [Syntrophotaleaceae bacterium]